VIINGYVDESESDGVFVMAGFVAPAEKWAKFSDAWDAAKFAVPAALDQPFKTKEIMRPRPSGAFWGMTGAQRDEKLATLYSVIDAHASYSVYSIVHMKPLQELTEAYGFRKEAANPYYHCISEIIIGTALVQLSQGIDDEKIDWIFDERLKESGQFLSIWNAIVHDAPDHVKPLLSGSPIFRDDNEVRPLQAADLEAWWMRRRALEELGIFPERLEYPWAATGMGICGGTANAETLAKKFAEMDRIRSELAILDPKGELF
jgi:hypothetical protein